MPAWDHLEPHLPHVFRFAMRLTGDVHQAEDLTQETFLRAWKQRTSLHDLQKARVWLFRITANLMKDRMRRSSRRSEPASLSNEILESITQLPETLVIQNEEIQQALQAVESLPPRQREVLHLAAVEDLAPAEIAEVLDISRNAVNVHLCEARKAMRQLLPRPARSVPSTEPI